MNQSDLKTAVKCQVSVSGGWAWHFSVVFVIFGGPIWRLSWMTNMQIPLKCIKTIFSLEIINFFKENNLLVCLYTYLYLINYWELFLRLRSERKAKLAWVAHFEWWISLTLFSWVTSPAPTVQCRGFRNVFQRKY